MAAPTALTAIWLALQSRVETLPFSPPVAIAWPDEHFAPTDAPYIAVSLIEAPTERQMIGSRRAHRHSGELILTLFHPIGQPTVAQRELAGRIVEHFPDDLCMSFGTARVRVTRRPDMAGSYRDEGRIVWPVSVPWESFV